MGSLFSLRFWYPAKTHYEDALPGFKVRRRRVAEICGEGHLLYEDITGARLLCGKETKKIEKSLEAAHVIRSDRLDGKDVCPKCLEAWKSLPESPWRKWVDSVRAQA